MLSQRLGIVVDKALQPSTLSQRCWGRRSQQDGEPAPGGISPKTLPGLPLPEAWAVVSLLVVDSSIPRILGQGESWCWAFRGCFVSAGEEQRLLSFPNDVGREGDGRVGTRSFCSVQIPAAQVFRTICSGGRWLRQLPSSVPQSGEPCFAFSSSFSLTASPMCIH